jgi:hypothetical protein
MSVTLGKKLEESWDVCMHAPGKLCGMCAAIPRYLRDVRNAGWAGQVFKDDEELEAWLA